MTVSPAGSAALVTEESDNEMDRVQEMLQSLMTVYADAMGSEPPQGDEDEDDDGEADAGLEFGLEHMA